MAVIRNTSNSKKERIKLAGVISGDIKIYSANVAGEEKEILRAKLNTPVDGEMSSVRVCCWSPSDVFIDFLSISSDEHRGVSFFGYWKKSQNPKYEDTFVIDERMTMEVSCKSKEQPDDFINDKIPF